MGKPPHEKIHAMAEWTPLVAKECHGEFASETGPSDDRVYTALGGKHPHSLAGKPSQAGKARHGETDVPLRAKEPRAEEASLWQPRH